MSMKDLDRTEEIWKEFIAKDKQGERSVWLSNKGRIKTVHRGTKQLIILKEELRKSGHPRNNILKQIPGFEPQIYIAIAKAFVPNPDNKTTVIHKDGDKTNNTAENLEWINPDDFINEVKNNPEALKTRDTVSDKNGEQWIDVITFNEGDGKRHVLLSNYGRVKFFHFFERKYVLANINVSNDFEQCGQLSGSKYSQWIHKAMAEAFIENPENKKFVIHLDHDKLNNSIANLEWANQEEVTEHNKDNPNVISFREEGRRTYTKISEGRAKLLKKRLLDPNRKTRIKILAKQYGLSEMQLWRIKSGENWGDLEID